MNITSIDDLQKIQENNDYTNFNLRPNLTSLENVLQKDQNDEESLFVDPMSFSECCFDYLIDLESKL